MQALKERISSKLSEKSKSKDKDKDGHSSLKTSSSADGKHSSLHDSHHNQAASSSSSAIAASSTVVTAQSAEKGIDFVDKKNDEIYRF
jgi:hypothetical protein